MKYHYSSPILASIFRITGLLTLCAAAFVLYTVFSTPRTAYSDYATVYALLASAGIFLAALIQFGVAQIIDCVAKTAYHAEHTAVLLKEIVRRLPEAGEPTSQP